MAAPWEKYAATTATAPWEKYSSTQPKDDDYSDPLKGFKVSSPGTPPKVDMKEAPMPGLTKVALEGVVKPANSALKGYNEGVAGGAKMLGNVAKGIENVTGLKRGGMFDEMEQVHRQNAADLEGRGADGVAGALYEAGGRLAPDLAKYTAASAALGPVAGMAAVDAATEADKGLAPALEAGAKGALMGGTMHVSQPASLPYRVGGMAAAGGGQAALSGGTPTDIAANAITMGAMAIPGGKGVSPLEARAAVKAGKANLETQARGQAEREWAQTNVADAMGVRPLAEKTVPGTSPGQIKAKAQDIAAQDIVGKPFGKLSKEEAAQVSAALRDKELRKHYEQQATDALPQGDQILPDGSPVPLGPDLKAAQANRKAKLAAKFGSRAEREAAYQEGLADAQRKPATPPELEWPAPLKSAEESAAVLGDIPVQPAAESAKVFNKELGKRQPKQPGPVVPETGVPEQVLRTQDARERMAQQYAGKPWDQLSNSERIQIDNWISEGNQGTVTPPVQTPAPASRPVPGRPAPLDVPQLRMVEPEPTPVAPPRLETPGTKPAQPNQDLRVLDVGTPIGDGRYAVRPMAQVGANVGKFELLDTSKPDPVYRDAARGEAMPTPVRGKDGKSVKFPSEEAAQKYVEQPLKSGDPIKVSDKSVRDFPVMIHLTGNTVSGSLTLAGKRHKTITLDRSEWPQSKFIGRDGKPMDNPLYHQRELVRKKMTEAGIADFNGDGAGQAERIADAHLSAINKAFALQDAASGSPASEPSARTPTRASSQRGGLTVPNPFAPKQQQNLSPSERHFQEQAAIRDKAKRGADSTFMDRLEKLRQAYRATFNDTTVSMTDNLKPLDATAGKGVLKATTKMHNFIDKVYRSSSIATRMIQDAGFEHVLKNAENLTYLDQFMIARRGAELEANGFRTGRDRAMDAQAVKDFGNRIAVPATKTDPAMTYAQVADKFTAFNNQLLDMSVKSGVVNADIAAHLKAKYKNYVPIDRVMDAVESAHRGAQGASQIASLSRQTIVQKLVGSERLIDDSIVSSIQRADRVMNQVTRNDAATHLTDSLTQLDPTGTGGLIRKLKQGETGPSDRTIHRYSNGVKESYVTTPELAAAAKSLDVKQLGWVVQNFFSPAVRLMKTFTTGLSLPFTVANVIRDMGHTAITQKGGIGGLFSPEVWREAGDVLAGKSEVVKNMERGGGGFTSFDLARGQVTPEVELMRAKRGAGDAVKYLGAHPARALGAFFRASENILSRSEQIGRARIWQTAYGRAIKEGYSKADAHIVATVESNNVLPNYSRAGSLGRTLNAIIPYFNARIQGVRSLTRAFEQNPTGTISKVGALFGAVVAGAAYNLMDEKRKAVYFDMPEYERRTNIVVVGPNAKKDARGRWTGILKVPLPQGLDSLSDVWRKGIESLHGGDPMSFNDIAESLIGAFTPVDPLPVSKNIGANLVAGVATTMTPQLVKPTIQSISNRDFFRQQPKEPLSMQDLPAQDRAHPYTSGTAKAVARDVLPKVGIETSPIKVEEFVKDTFGGGGGMVVNLVDRAAMATGAIPEQPIGGQGPIDATVSRLTSGRGGDYDTHYYELRKQAQDIIAHRNIAMLQSNPNFNQLPRETQRKLTRSEVAKARVAIGKVTKDGKLDDAPGPQKVEVMRQFLDRIK